LAATLRAIVTLALCSASFVFLLWQLGSEWPTEFARTNLLRFAERKDLRNALIATGLLVSMVSAAYCALSGVKARIRLERLAGVAAPLVLLGLIPAVLIPKMWDPLTTAMAIAAFTLLLETLLRGSFRSLFDWAGVPRFAAPQRRKPRWPWAPPLAVLAGVALYAFYSSKYTLWMHRRFATYGYDLGQYDSVFWTTLHGHPMQCTPLGLIKDWHELGNHADIAVFFLVPFYAIRPNSETLLIMQAVILALGAIPIYLFAARRLPAAHACFLALCYLLYAPMHGANFYDFHYQPLASTFVLFTICFIDARRWILAALAFVVAITCREDISVGLALFGVYLILSGHRPRAGGIIAACSVVYFVVMRFYIMPSFGPSWFSDIFKDLYPVPDGPSSYSGVMQTLMTNPAYVFKTLLTGDKLRYFLQIVTPIAFLPLRRIRLLPALVPGTIFTLLSTDYGPTIDIGFQYSGHFVPYIFTASAVALASYRFDSESRVKVPASLIALGAGTLLCYFQWGLFVPRGSIKGGFHEVPFTRPTEAHRQKERDLRELWEKIPKDATFSVSEEELPHVSGHMHCYTLRDGHNSAEYLLYGTESGGAGVGNKALADGEYVEVERRPGLVLLRKKH
jgi:uncharacterized membrane protein